MHHRSVAKTRSELERIAQKINQLKEKHTLDAYPLETNGWIQNKKRRDSANSKQLRPDSYKNLKSAMLNT